MRRRVPGKQVFDGLSVYTSPFPEVSGGGKVQLKTIRLFSIPHGEEDRSLMRLLLQCSLHGATKTEGTRPRHYCSHPKVQVVPHQCQRIFQDSSKRGSLYPWHESSAMRAGEGALGIFHILVQLPKCELMYSNSRVCGDAVEARSGNIV